MKKKSRPTMIKLSANAAESLLLDSGHLPDNHWFRMINPDELLARIKKAPSRTNDALADAGLPALRYCPWCNRVLLLEEIAYSITTLFYRGTEYVCKDCASKTP